MSVLSGIVVAADFTADPIVDALEFWARQFGWAEEIRFAPYNQVIQTLLDPAGAFAGNDGGVNVVLVRENRLTAEFAAELRGAAGGYRGAPLVIAVCPSDSGGGTLALERDSVYVMQAADIARRYPVADVFDAHAEELGDVPYTPMYFAALGTAVARTVHAIRLRPYKVITLDCDNTLWRGTCGEDGPEGVVLGEAQRRLQEFVRARRDAGMLLTIASKNNEADVAETFRMHPEMPLGWDDFIAKGINWEPKGGSIREMAGELGLGLDSFIFVDDNAKEVGEVLSDCPEVLGLTLPHDETRIAHFLEHVWAFDSLRVTAEDRRRNESYKQQVERGKVEKAAGSLGDFVAQLAVEINLQPVQLSQVARVAQLTQRTNQMNTTLARRTESDVAAMVWAEPVRCLTVDVTDRFGSYGLVGVLFLAYKDEAVVVEGLLLSCRALGRGVEHRMLAQTGRIALELGKAFVEIGFVLGRRNAPAKQLVESVGRRLSAKACAELKYEPAARAALAAETVKVGGGGRTFQEYGRIARDFNNAAQILEAIRLEKVARSSHLPSTDPARTELEHQLAAVWADVLRVPVPGREDDFFDLGGHSLLAVQLLSRVKRDLGVELPLDMVYTGKLTVASMAAAVELAQADPEEVDRLLAEIDHLSDEELRALLESE